MKILVIDGIIDLSQIFNQFSIIFQRKILPKFNVFYIFFSKYELLKQILNLGKICSRRNYDGKIYWTNFLIKKPILKRLLFILLHEY